MRNQAVWKKWYEANKARGYCASCGSRPALRPYINCEVCRSAVERRRAVNGDLIKHWKARPCTDCGHTFPPEAMHCDHVRGVKTHNLSRMLSWATARVLLELTKCEPRCANCHAIVTKARWRYIPVRKVSKKAQDMIATLVARK